MTDILPKSRLFAWHDKHSGGLEIVGYESVLSILRLETKGERWPGIVLTCYEVDLLRRACRQLDAEEKARDMAEGDSARDEEERS